MTDALDVRVFLRVPHDLLKRRREERQTYVLQSESPSVCQARQTSQAASLTRTDPDDAAAGGVWVDPPDYFDQIVYPGYIKAHEHIFDGVGAEGVEMGDLRPEWKDRLRVIRHADGAQGMARCFEDACGEILGRCEAGAGVYI